MLNYILSGWCYESAILDYMASHNCKGNMIGIECKDSKTIIVKFTSELGPWDLTITRTSKGCYVLVNDCLYQHNANNEWEYMCRI